MIYNTGTLSVSGNTATGTGTNWTAAASQVRAGQTLIVLSNPVQMFQITTVNSATSLTVTPAASPALNGQKYGILVSDAMSLDGLAQAMSQLINEYDENIGAWEAFAGTTANQNITVTINGVSMTIPALGKLAQKGANSDITELKGLTTALSVPQGGSGAKNAADARKNFDVYSKAEVDSIENYVPWNDPSVTALLTFDITSGATELLVRVTPTYCHIIGIIRKTMDSGNTSLFVVKALPAGRAAVRTPHSVCFLTGGGVSSLLPTIVGTQSGVAGTVMRVSTVTTAALAAIVDMKIFFY